MPGTLKHPWCSRHERLDCRLCDECGHEGALHLSGHEDVPEILDAPTCWAQDCCLECLHAGHPTCPSCRQPVGNPDCPVCAAEPMPADALYPLRLPLDDAERAMVERAVLDLPLQGGGPEEVRLDTLATLICDVCGEPVDVLDPAARNFHRAEVLP
jgi:hypothetical protein